MAGINPISLQSLDALAYHLEQGKDNAGITREALAAFLRHVADQARSTTPPPNETKEVQDANRCD